MAEETATKPATRKTAKKGSGNKMWLGVLIVIILVLGGANFYYMKKNKELKDAIAKKKNKNLVKQKAQKNAGKDVPTDGSELGGGETVDNTK